MSETKKEIAPAQPEAKQKAVKRETAQKETVMYIGPSIKNVVITGTLYNNGLPEILRSEMEKQPVIGSLIVPMSRLAAAQKEIATPGSALNLIYNKVVTK